MHNLHFTILFLPVKVTKSNSCEYFNFANQPVRVVTSYSVQHAHVIKCNATEEKGHHLLKNK